MPNLEVKIAPDHFYVADVQMWPRLMKEPEPSWYISADYMNGVYDWPLARIA